MFIIDIITGWQPLTSHLHGLHPDIQYGQTWHVLSISVCLSVCLSVFPFVCLSLFCILYYFHSSFWKGKVYLDIRINSRSRWGLSPTNIRINFASPETRMTVLPDAENSTIVSSFYWTKHRNVTDRRTDGQTARAVTAVCIATNSDAL